MLIDEIRKTIGEKATDKLIAQFGGLRISVPTLARCDRKHRLVRALGLAAAWKLSERFGGEQPDIPNPPPARRENICRLHAAGVSQQKIALTVGCTARWVREVLRESREQLVASIPRPAP